MEKQAIQLVNLSGLTDPILKKETVNFIVKDKLIVRPLAKLVALLGHPCSQEQIENINVQFKRKYYSAGNEEGIVKPFLKDEILETMAHDAAAIIGEGFDVAFKDNLQVNSETGAIVVNRDKYGNPDTRFLKCAAAEIPLQSPSNPADPYKGSQQGLGKTRKHKKHSKKTLRRRKMRRNVH